MMQEHTDLRISSCNAMQYYRFMDLPMHELHISICCGLTQSISHGKMPERAIMWTNGQVISDEQQEQHLWLGWA